MMVNITNINTKMTRIFPFYKIEYLCIKYNLMLALLLNRGIITLLKTFNLFTF